MPLDFYQQKAAFQDNRYSIIIAGAGTGKTHTLLGRIQYLIQELHLKPEEILVISYTNETVKEFQKKVHQELGCDVSVYTFHKLALTILQQNDLFDSNYIDDSLSFITQEFFESFCFYNPFLRNTVNKIFTPFYFSSKNYYNKLIKTQKGKDLQKELVQFIHLLSSKGGDSKQISHLYLSSTRRQKYFLILVFVLWHLFQSEKLSQGEMDFDDLIRQASNLVDQLAFFPYKHILVDEFQDSSFMRISFFKTLVDKFHLSFTVVGDDCQSIYRFSGTESNCFSILKDFFPTIHTYYLKYTYRNSQELIDIANDFILKNPVQIKKNIFSYKHLNYPIEILYYKNPYIMKKLLFYILRNEDKDILFLGRNSFDWKYYFLKSEITWLDKKHFKYTLYPNKIFTFLTVHQSKGLEADVVIVLHMENSKYGFPCQVVSPSYCNFFKSSFLFPYDEERRLFYVALTRTKEKVYLLTPAHQPSYFILELQKNYKKNIKSIYL